LPGIENHTEHADNAVGDIVSTLRIAFGMSDHPRQFTFQSLVGALHEIAAPRALKFGKAVSEIQFPAVGIVGVVIELRLTAQRCIQARKPGFQLLLCAQCPSDRLIKRSARTVAALRERRRLPAFLLVGQVELHGGQCGVAGGQ
jgi:hypothetical protein